MNGIQAFSARIVRYPEIPQSLLQGIKKRPALLLERALLIAFKERYASVPVCNTMGKKMKVGGPEFSVYSKRKILRILEDIE